MGRSNGCASLTMFPAARNALIRIGCATVSLSFEYQFAPDEYTSVLAAADLEFEALIVDVEVVV